MGFLKTLAMDNGIQIKTIPDEYKAPLASCDGGCENLKKPEIQSRG